MSTTTVSVDLTTLMSERKDFINKTVESALLENLKNTLSWSAESQIKNAVEGFCKNTLAPEIAAYLDANKTEIISEVKKSVDEAFRVASEQLTKKAADNLAQSWNIQKIMDVMFK